MSGSPYPLTRFRKNPAELLRLGGSTPARPGRDGLVRQTPRRRISSWFPVSTCWR